MRKTSCNVFNLRFVNPKENLSDKNITRKLPIMISLYNAARMFKNLKTALDYWKTTEADYFANKEYSFTKPKKAISKHTITIPRLTKKEIARLRFINLKNWCFSKRPSNKIFKDNLSKKRVNTIELSRRQYKNNTQRSAVPLEIGYQRIPPKSLPKIANLTICMPEITLLNTKSNLFESTKVSKVKPQISLKRFTIKRNSDNVKLIPQLNITPLNAYKVEKTKNKLKQMIMKSVKSRENYKKRFISSVPGEKKLRARKPIGELNNDNNKKLSISHKGKCENDIKIAKEKDKIIVIQRLNGAILFAK